jgi:MFS family permease
LITSLMTLGGLLSSLVAGVFSVYFGRKIGLWVACVFTSVGIAIQMATENRGAIYFGRLVLGLGNGFLQTFSNMYCAEVAPAHLRAIMVGLSTQAILIGNIIAAAITNQTQVHLDEKSFRIPFGALFIPALFLSIGLFFVPESPRYLLTQGRAEAARESLERLRGDSLQSGELELEYTEMIKGIEEEKQIAATVGPLDMFRGEQSEVGSNASGGSCGAYMKTLQDLTADGPYFVWAPFWQTAAALAPGLSSPTTPILW